MAKEIRQWHVGDTLTVLTLTCQQENASGVLAAKDLTGLATPQFKMLNTADGTTKVALSTTGVTVTVALSGTLTKDFLAADVDTAGIFRCFVVVTNTDVDTFPAKPNDMLLHINSDTQTAQEAYEAAVAAL